MATNPKPDQKAALDRAVAGLITDIERQYRKMSPVEREAAHKKTMAIAARVRARREKP